MKTNLIKLSTIAALSAILSACVVAPPPQPIGYRITAPVLPTYVNGQYVGMQPSNYVAPAQPSSTTTTTTHTPATATSPATTTTSSTTTTTAPTTVASNPAPVYLQATNPSVVYVQAPTPVYTPYYDPYYAYGPYPYYAPYWGGPWFGGVGVGIGLRVRIH